MIGIRGCDPDWVSREFHAGYYSSTVLRKKMPDAKEQIAVFLNSPNVQKTAKFMFSKADLNHSQNIERNEVSRLIQKVSRVLSFQY